jgi:hypothetical protein
MVPMGFAAAHLGQPHIWVSHDADRRKRTTCRRLVRGRDGSAGVGVSRWQVGVPRWAGPHTPDGGSLNRPCSTHVGSFG